jgi:hypothetical protein
MDIPTGPRYVISKVLSPEPTKPRSKNEAQPYTIFLWFLLLKNKKAFLKISVVTICSTKKVRQQKILREQGFLFVFTLKFLKVSGELNIMSPVLFNFLL